MFSASGGTLEIFSFTNVVSAQNVRDNIRHYDIRFRRIMSKSGDLVSYRGDEISQSSLDNFSSLHIALDL